MFVLTIAHGLRVPRPSRASSTATSSRRARCPGKYYHFEEVQLPGAPLYFTIYFLATGLHAFHVIIGMSVLVWLTVKALRQKNFGPNNYTAVELGSMYWHLVDLVWIFLFPLLYLI